VVDVSKRNQNNHWRLWWINCLNQPTLKELNMANPTLIRATEKDGVVDVRILMKHEMETGLRKSTEDKLIPAWHITNVEAKIGDTLVFGAQFGPSVSKDPFLHFKLKGSAKKGDLLSFTWLDNRGQTRTDTSTIK
jgi:sulfur-oxidizing protein SoxZ